MPKARIWRPKDFPMPMFMNPERGHNVTMIGAISSITHEPFVEVYPKTNKTCVRAFFEN